MSSAIASDADRIAAARLAAELVEWVLLDRGAPLGFLTVGDSLGGLISYAADRDPRYKSRVEAGIGGPVPAPLGPPGATGPSFPELDRRRPRPWV